MNRVLGLVVASLACLPSATGQTNGGHWIGAWGAAPQAQLQIPIPGVPPVPVYQNQTVRMIVRPTIGGDRLRIRLSNAYGQAALKVGAVHIALIDSGSRIVPDSDRQLTFGGEKGITIPPGAPALSDPVNLTVAAFSEVAVSIYLPEKTSVDTFHMTGQREVFTGGPGDLTAQREIADATAIHSWFWLAGLEVWKPQTAAAIIAFGDSITDGFGAKPGDYLDWPDQLANRLAATKGLENFSVVNEGIGGNRILHDGLGVSALARFDRDVLAQPGVSDVILLEGINDIGWPHQQLPKGMDLSKLHFGDVTQEHVTATDLIAGMRQMIDRAHEHGIRIFGATILPFEGANYFSTEGEETRQAVNQWIRSSGAFDGVVDFDAAVRDPAHPSRFRADYQSGDYLHPNAAGYKVMADSVALSLFR